MGKLTSPAGDQIFEMLAIRTSVEGVVMVTRMGVWNAEVHLSYKEMAVAFLTPKALLAILKIPVLLLKGSFRQKEK